VNLHNIIRNFGTKYPKKHGEWYRLHVFDDHYLVLDTWNNYIYHYPNGAKPSDTNNMYGCVYVFYDKEGKVNNYKKVNKIMNDFWYYHVYYLNSNK